MISADQLVAHAVGDYIIQSDWMATEKTKKSLAAFVHALTYTLVFLALTRSVPALLVIFGTHFVIDRWRLARYLVWAKNHIAPKWLMGMPGTDGAFHVKPFYDVPTELREETAVRKRMRNWPWSECKATGYPPTNPPWLAVWLLIIADNILHVLCNGLALKFL